MAAGLWNLRCLVEHCFVKLSVLQKAPSHVQTWFFSGQEFFRGCLKFRGHARAIEVGKVLQDQQWLIRTLQT